MLVILSLSMAACQPQKTEFKNTQDSDTGLFSNRPSQNQNFSAMVKLKNPPLLSKANKEKGVTKVNPEMAKALDQEQQEFLTKLGELAPNIKVIYRYRLILNGFSLSGSVADLEKIKALVQVASVETDGGFSRPIIKSKNFFGGKKANEGVDPSIRNLAERNSVKFIGAESLHSRKIKDLQGNLVNLDGTGMKVGVLDTGIDYTHSMLGGSGNPDDFKNNNPSLPNSAFPNSKVVGGIDLVGTEFNAASADFSKREPHPDTNPIDEGGHGSHVAGSIAGIGDGVSTYSGVAPGAVVYAIKVFGAEGSTSDSTVIAGLEYSADPNKDDDFSDQLDVVNMSLGGPFGSSKILYNEAIRNLSNAGTVVVASAGNEGNVDYITGAPAVSDEAISVAASIDNADHNWQNAAVKFHLPQSGEVLAEAVEAAMTKPIQKAGPVSGKLVYAGLAKEDFTEELAAQIKGNVAFIDRGQVAFVEKIKRAAHAGAIGVVVANNQAGAAFVMGGDDKFEFDIPAIMVTQALGDQIKTEMKSGDSTIEFLTSEKIMHPERIDTITDFSSKGPRTFDSLIKPEISSPGQDIISAKMGGGTAGVKMSGTSMAGPHIAGAMALLKQAHQNLSSSDLKALLMNQAVVIRDEEKSVYPISRQGAGRVQIDKSVDAEILVQPYSLSLGEISVETKKVLQKSLTIRNTSSNDLKVKIELVNRGAGLSLRSVPAQVLPAGKEANLDLRIIVDATKMSEIVREMDGWVVIKDESGLKELARVPVLALARKVSNIQVDALTIESTQVASAGSLASLTLTNKAQNDGEVLLFNLLAQDLRKKDPYHDPSISKDCDVQSVGYRILKKKIGDETKDILQIAAKTYQPVTQWSTCELSVLIDSDGDSEADQELAAVAMGNVPGIFTPQNERSFASALFNAKEMRKIRRQYELDSVAFSASPKSEDKEKPKEDYSEALMDLIPSVMKDHTTVVIVEADISMLSKRPTGEIGIKIASQEFSGTSPEADDFVEGLKFSADGWLKLSVQPSSQGYSMLPESVTVKANESTEVNIEKGYGHHELMVLLPQNLTVFSDVVEDQQQVIPNAKYLNP